MSLASNQTRREFLGGASRWIVAGIVGLGTLRMVTRPADACVGDGVCAGCAELARCPRPEAEAELEQRAGGED